MIKPPPEKLGSFYLGAEYDPEKKEILKTVVNYDSRDLTTHAVCVGMTGSGKTGLCIGLLEEAAIDQVPAIIIDPKGDMTNLLLQFEELKAKQFKPWINPDDARRKDMDIDSYAETTATTWREGLAQWGQDSKRIKTLRSAVDFTIYTPGSDAGIPVNILGSFAAPDLDFENEAETIRERIQATTAALLGMIQSKADPVRSREGILLSNIFEHRWREGQDLSLSSIIMDIQNPPMTKLGVFDIDTFFPEKDRFDLAMSFNSLIASPQFGYWLKGDPLDIDHLYFTEDGKPRHSIFYIAHLSDSERMFFVTLLLNSLVSWMRKQSGTTSLRSLVYFDELFGYFPPTAEPPSKKPLLTILKQGRAFGLGAVLVSQNPVDIDYKGLSNAGTWFIGKLQTEQDKDRLLSGLEGAIAESGKNISTDYSKIISSLSSRVFLLQNVHEDSPVLFHTRWVMSYLRGPMTRPQIKVLMDDKNVEKRTTTKSNDEKTRATTPNRKVDENIHSVPPSVDPDVEQRFIKLDHVSRDEGISVLYKPFLFCAGSVRFYNAKRDIDEGKKIAILLDPPDEFGRIPWSSQTGLGDAWPELLIPRPNHHSNSKVQFEEVPGTLNSAREMKNIRKEFSDWLYREQKLTLHQHEELDLIQKAGESLTAFQGRIMQQARENRDEEMDELQDKFQKKLDRISDRIRKEEFQIAEQESEVSQRKTTEWLTAAETLISVFSGRRKSVSSATTKSRMRRKAEHRLAESRADLAALQGDYTELQEELSQQLDEIRNRWEDQKNHITEYQVEPRRVDVKVTAIYLVWKPEELIV